MTFKELLASKKITQAQLADKMGVKRQMVSRWVRGDTTPRPVTVQKLANSVGVSYNTMLNCFYKVETVKTYIKRK